MSASLCFVILSQYLCLKLGLFWASVCVALLSRLRSSRNLFLECVLILHFFCWLKLHHLGFGQWLLENPIRMWALNRAYHLDPSGSMAALLFASNIFWDDWYRSIVRQSGLIHLWVVSGQHLFQLRRVLYQWVPARCVPWVLGFYVCLLCGGSVPLLRALCDHLLAKRFAKKERMLWVWYLLLCCAPDRAMHASLLYSVWMAWWLYARREWPRHVNQFQFSIDAWIGMIFPLWAWGMKVHPLAWLWDAVWGPWVLYVLYPMLWLTWCLGLDRWGVVLGKGMAHLMLAMNDAHYLFEAVGEVDASWSVVTLAGLLISRSYRHRPWRVVLLFLCLSVQWKDASSFIRVFDVGRGQSVLWVYQDSAVLFDTGDRQVARRVADYLRRHRLRLDGIVLSHGDQDHAGGLSVLRGFLKKQKNIWAPNGAVQFLSPIKHHRYAIQSCHRGLQQLWGGSVWRVVHPEKHAHYEGNQTSCVWLWDHPGQRWLLPGDINAQVEMTLLHELAGRVDVLLLAHHGSRHSNHVDWLRRLHAKCFLVSVHARVWARNQAELLSRLKKAQPAFQVYPTAGKGDMHIRLPQVLSKDHEGCNLQVEYVPP